MSPAPETNPRVRKFYYVVYGLVFTLGLVLLLIFGHEPPGPAGYIFLVSSSVSALVFRLTGVNILGGSGRGGSSGGGSSGGGGGAP